MHFIITIVFLQASPSVNSTGAYFYNCHKDRACPAQCTKTWIFHDGEKWAYDDSLTITCGKCLSGMEMSGNVLYFD